MGWTFTDVDVRLADCKLSNIVVVILGHVHTLPLESGCEHLQTRDSRCHLHSVHSSANFSM